MLYTDLKEQVEFTCDKIDYVSAYPYGHLEGFTAVKDDIEVRAWKKDDGTAMYSQHKVIK
jgi:hypothetical protein